LRRSFRRQAISSDSVSALIDLGPNIHAGRDSVKYRKIPAQNVMTLFSFSAKLTPQTDPQFEYRSPSKRETT